jgi:hypothetical protein
VFCSKDIILLSYEKGKLVIENRTLAKRVKQELALELRAGREYMFFVGFLNNGMCEILNYN